MYAIVEIAGQQFKVEEGKKIFVHRLDVEEGQKVDFDQVLLIDDEGKITIGEPVIKNAVVEGKVVENVRGDKVIVFKKKRKKGYRTRNGHRQNFTQVEIVSINSKVQAKKAAEKKAEPPAVEETLKEAVVAEQVGEPEKPARKKASKTGDKAGPAKPAARKQAAGKPAAKKPAAGKEKKGEA